MDKVHWLLRYLALMVSKCLVYLTVLFTVFGCKRNPESSHKLYIDNRTSRDLYFQINRNNSSIRAYGTALPANKTTMLGDGGEHLYGNDIIFQIIRESHGLSTDTVEILRNDTIVIKWGGPLCVMPDSINHFYNEKSWKIEMGGTNNTYEIGTFTIYESDIGHIEGK